MFRVVSRLVLAVLLFWMFVAPLPATAQRACGDISTGLVPLTDLGAGDYLGEQGGLYPGGSNVVPQGHLELGLELSRQVSPRNEEGDPDPSGSIGLISIGVSNTFIEFERFIEVAGSDSAIEPRLALVNGAQGSRALDEWAVGPEANPWFNLAIEVERAGMSPEQVQVAWVKLPDRSRGTVSFEDAAVEIDRLGEVVRIAKELYPNLRLVYLSSRIYGGYGGSADSEPKAYQNGFAIKWLIERQIEGDPELNADPDAGRVVAPWLAWGPYLWADGMVPRSDGLVWECDDFDDDGIHPGPDGADKVAGLLLEHFSTHSTSNGWFLAGQSTTSLPSTTETTSPPLTSTSAPRRNDRSAPPPPEDRPRRAQPATRPDPLGTLDLSDEVAWLVAGAAVGIGVSLTVVFAVAARRQQAPVDGPLDDF